MCLFHESSINFRTGLSSVGLFLELEAVAELLAAPALVEAPPLPLAPPPADVVVAAAAADVEAFVEELLLEDAWLLDEAAAFEDVDAPLADAELEPDCGFTCGDCSN